MGLLVLCPQRGTHPLSASLSAFSILLSPLTVGLSLSISRSPKERIYQSYPSQYSLGQRILVKTLLYLEQLSQMTHPVGRVVVTGFEAGFPSQGRQQVLQGRAAVHPPGSEAPQQSHPWRENTVLSSPSSCPHAVALFPSPGTLSFRGSINAPSGSLSSQEAYAKSFQLQWTPRLAAYSFWSARIAFFFFLSS